MRIQFCGADRTVTGSCHLLEVNNLRIFLDMGMSQGPRDESHRLNLWLPDDALSADAIILSHGHLDHCGKLPVLTSAGYDGPIYCTSATADVARIVLNDAAQIQEEDAAYLNRRMRAPGERRVEPLYVPSDIPKVQRQMQRLRYEQRHQVGPDVWMTLRDAGHILGSAYVIVEWRDAGGAMRRLLFTADVGRSGTPIVPDPAPLDGPVDIVITESTYGGRQHAPMDEVGPQLLQAVRDCIERRGRLLVPSFAVGRTQTILWYLQRFIQEKLIPAIPLFVDSPMGTDVSEIHSRHRDTYDDETREAIGHRDLFGTSRVTFARSIDESKRINSQQGPCVIIASSPTCEFGRILHHLKISIDHESDIVVFVGWTPPHTLGRRLQDGQKRARIYDRWYDVRCDVRTIHGLSAHADGDEIVRFLKPTIRPETQFYIVHGEPDEADALAQKLIESGAARIAIPAMETGAIIA